MTRSPTWPKVSLSRRSKFDEIIYYYAEPKEKREATRASTRSTPSCCETFNKLGIPLLEEQKRLTGVAVDAVFDSVSVATTFKDKLLEKLGVIFCSASRRR